MISVSPLEKYLLTFSLVLYKHSLADIVPLLSSINNFTSSQSIFKVNLCVYDGSPADYSVPLKSDLLDYLQFVSLTYQRGINIGFGSANNVNFLHCPPSDRSFFIVVNPDISFSIDILEFFLWISRQSKYSCVAPLILLRDGQIQFSAKKNPTFLSLLIGRLHWLKTYKVFSTYDKWHKNMSCDYSRDIIQVRICLVASL